MALKAKGVDLSDIYQTLNISEAKLNDSGSLLTAEEFAKLLRIAFEISNDEAVGYTKRPLKIGTFRMMCYATVNCDNLRRAIIRMIDFFALLSDEFDWSLSEQGEEAVLTINNQPNGLVENHYFIGNMMTILWRWASWMIDTPILLNRVYFKFDGNDDALLHSHVFGSEVYFNQSNNQIVFPQSYLNQTIKQDSESLINFLADSPEVLLSHYQSDNSLSQQVKLYLEQQNELEEANLDSSAQHFDMSSQTLSRRLKKEGHQFQEIKDRVRKSRAIKLLQDAEVSFSDISTALGFSEDSVFYRNFKKWTGMTPGEYRHKILG
jgi:AraC-like DNA-binding protein